MSKTSPTDCSKLFFNRLDKAARKTKFIQRQSAKFSAAGYLFALIKSILTGKGSFNQLAAGLKKSETHSLSKQALWKRTNRLAVSFMLDALSLAMQEKWRCSFSKSPGITRHFRRVLVQDSTQQKLPKSNHDHFPAHGNGKSVTAGVKVDLAIDLLHGHTVLASLHGATEQDRDLGKNLVDLVRKRDLILRDRGYFVINEFRLIAKKGAYWLSRVPSNLLISDQDGTALHDRLEKEESDLLDLTVFLGEEKYEARLTVIRANKAVTSKNLREARERACAQGRTLSKAQRIRCQWHIVVSNIPREMLSAKQVAELYRCRWNIEIIFRAWKQSANLSKALNRKSNEDHFQVLMLAGMIYQVMSLSMLILMRTLVPKVKRVSYEKLFDHFSEWITECQTFAEIWSFDPDPRHITMESRKDRRPLEDTWIKLLS